MIQIEGKAPFYKNTLAYNQEIYSLLMREEKPRVSTEDLS
jgi:hypothetical protein